MLNKLDVNVYQLINLLRIYKGSEIGLEDLERKKYWINSLMENQQDYPVGDEIYMDKLNNIVRHKFLEEPLSQVSIKEQRTNFTTTW